MDRPIDIAYARRERLRRAAILLLIVALGATGVITVPRLLRPGVRRTRIRTAVVDRGPIEETITASGRVIPDHEHVITSPVATRVTGILKQPGDRVETEEPIVILDVGESELALEKLDDQIALLSNRREQSQVALETRLSELRGKREIQALELESACYRAARDSQLVALGVCSEDEARRSATDAKRARIELEQLTARMENARRALAVELEGLDLEIAMRRKERSEAARRLRLATAASDRPGVLTWVVPSEGAAVQRGDELARVADISAFRVRAVASDVHAPRLESGLPAEVRSGEMRLRGEVTHVQPTVQNGAITFDVTLDEDDHPNLRDNLRVDVYVVTERKEEAVRVKRGAYTRPDGTTAVFVIREDRAVRTPVRFGIKNMETYEILAGVTPGEEVIVSDMSDYMHAKEVKLR